MSCSETEKTFKSVSAVRLARAIEESFGKLQAVVRQRNGTILFEARTDEQIEKILKTEQIAGLQVEVTTHPTLNLCKEWSTMKTLRLKTRMNFFPFQELRCNGGVQDQEEGEWERDPHFYLDPDV